MENENQSAISMGTLVLSMILLVVVSIGLGLGAGFYFGSMTSKSEGMAAICLEMAKAYDGQVREMNINRADTEEKIQNYERFLLNVGVPTTAGLPKVRGGMGGDK